MDSQPDKKNKKKKKVRQCEACGDSFVKRTRRSSKRFCVNCIRAVKYVKRKTPAEKRETAAAYRKAHSEIYKALWKRWYNKQKLDQQAWQDLLRKRKETRETWAKTSDGKRKCRAQAIRAKHRRRARLRDSNSPGVPPEFWEAICRGNADAEGLTLCAYCKRPCNPTVDHVVPISRGGKDEISNVVAACQRCNSSKCNRLIHEWSRAKEFFKAHEIAAFAEAYARCGIK